MKFVVENSSLGRIVVAPGAPLFYTTRDFDGRLSNDVARRITQLIRDRFVIDASLTTCNQVHGARVESVAGPAAAPGEWRECDSCDALVSEKFGTALAIKVADCLPVTIVGDGAIANIHSGWRGAAQNITAAALDRLETDGAGAWLGPSIRVCCFEVGEEVAAQFDARFVDRSYLKPHVDIPAFTTEVLRSRGFVPDRIHDSGLCTRCEGSIFHSFRRDGSGGGRNLAIVAQ